jgi:hypothetical protein
MATFLVYIGSMTGRGQILVIVVRVCVQKFGERMRGSVDPIRSANGMPSHFSNLERQPIHPWDS